MDLGFIYKFRKCRLGGAVQNVGTELKLYEQSSPLPLVYKSGLAYNLHDMIWVSGQFFKYNDEDPGFNLGAEAGLRITAVDILYLRAGYRSGMGENAGSGITTGAGIKGRDVEFNYAFTPLGDIGSSHLITLAYKFKGLKKTLKPVKRNTDYWSRW